MISKTSPKLSIIIPVYNVERYLEQNLLSVLEQTIEDKEIICINDGSTDRSGHILENFLKQNSSFIVIHKQNGNLASARNAGLKVATGQFVAFIDSDDWLYSPNIYEKMVLNLEKNNADIVMGNICRVYQDGRRKIENFNMKPFINSVFTSEDINPFTLIRRPCNKIYRRSFLQKHAILFPEEADRDQGAPFTLKCALKAQKMTAIEDVVYCYRIHNKEGSSLTSSRSDKLFLSALNVNRILIRDIVDNNAPISNRAFLHYQNFVKLLKRVDMVENKTLSPEKCYTEYRKQVMSYQLPFRSYFYFRLNSLRLYLTALMCKNFESYIACKKIILACLLKIRD